ncbi:acetate/propionate family kinase [Alcaligenaceae bacterium]|nr:acetate/propionate family kinase [Alcaligenaceae bacterium]
MSLLTDRYATRGDLILVLNCGSSSIKFALFDAAGSDLQRTPVWNGKVQGIGGPAPTYGETGITPIQVALDPERPYSAALARIQQGVLARLDGRKLHSVVHRVVHGGNKFFAPVRVNQALLDDLKAYIPLAPLHQPFALEAIETLLLSRPDLPQVACFDTAFHHTLPKVEQLLPLPYDAWERGLRRYGFHGLSYDYMATALPERHGDLACGRTIVAHLGSGASLCAMQNLKSVATTMGFSALDGLMMGTRTGALDPGAVLYLMEIEKLTLAEVGQVLYHKSGLLGVSGTSSEPRVLLPLESEDSEAGARARDALALYVRRIVREIGALVAVLGGLDMLVFTAGVGEHSAEIRKRICDALAFLGMQINDGANADNAPVISTPDSTVIIAVEPTNEEWVAASQALTLLTN